MSRVFTLILVLISSISAQRSTPGQLVLPQRTAIHREITAGAKNLIMAPKDEILAADAQPAIILPLPKAKPFVPYSADSEDLTDAAAKSPAPPLAEVLGLAFLRPTYSLDPRSHVSGYLRSIPAPSFAWHLAFGSIAWRYQDEDVSSRLLATLRAGLKYNREYPLLYHFARMTQSVALPQPSSGPDAQPNEYASLGRAGRSAAISAWSPAEKYSLIVRDTQFAFPRAIVEQQLPHTQSQGSLEATPGLSLGWSMSRLIDTTPTRPVTVKLDSDTVLTITPDDISALRAVLWADGGEHTYSYGTRCNQGAKSCAPLTPDVWHVVVTNKIARDGLGVVLNVGSESRPVYRPIVAFEVTYFNPTTLEVTSSLREAAVDSTAVPVANTGDPDFAAGTTEPVESHRSMARTVGVAMRVTIVNEKGIAAIDPLPKYIDLTYFYRLSVLENAETFAIVGGEWTSTRPPQGIVGPIDRKARPKSLPVDKEIDRKLHLGRSPLAETTAHFLSSRDVAELDLAGLPVLARKHAEAAPAAPLKYVSDVLLKLSQNP